MDLYIFQGPLAIELLRFLNQATITTSISGMWQDYVFFVFGFGSCFGFCWVKGLKSWEVQISTYCAIAAASVSATASSSCGFSLILAWALTIFKLLLFCVKSLPLKALVLVLFLYKSLTSSSFYHRHHYDEIIERINKIIPALEVEQEFLTKEKDLLDNETSGNSIPR